MFRINPNLNLILKQTTRNIYIYHKQNESKTLSKFASLKFRRLYSSASTEPEPDYLKIHKPSMFWFPSKKPTPENDSREIGPYPPSQLASNDLHQSYQLRPPDLPEYFERQGRRRFGETVPEEAEIQGMWNVDLETNYSVVYMLGGVIIFFGTLGGIMYLSSTIHDPFKSFRLQATQKELPYHEIYFPDKSKEQPIFFWSKSLDIDNKIK